MAKSPAHRFAERWSSQRSARLASFVCNNKNRVPVRTDERIREEATEVSWMVAYRFCWEFVSDGDRGKGRLTIPSARICVRARANCSAPQLPIAQIRDGCVFGGIISDGIRAALPSRISRSKPAPNSVRQDHAASSLASRRGCPAESQASFLLNLSPLVYVILDGNVYPRSKSQLQIGKRSF